MKRHPVYDAVKRPLDFMCALLLLVILSPILTAVAFAVLVTMGIPVLFRQERPGHHERIFTLYKFRTMRTGSGESDVDAVSTDQARLTRSGRFMRSISLDELPQLINVVRGEMSFIGPRPLLVEYLGHYTTEQAKRHLVRPGITGWAQVNGRNAVSWDDRLAMDAWYAENYSAELDARIVVMTIGAVFSRRGVSAEGEATVTPFTAPNPKSLGNPESDNDS